MLVAQSCPTLATPWTVARQAPLSMGFSRQEYWSGMPFPSPGQADFLLLSHQEKSFNMTSFILCEFHLKKSIRKSYPKMYPAWLFRSEEHLVGKCWGTSQDWVGSAWEKHGDPRAVVQAQASPTAQSLPLWGCLTFLSGSKSVMF